MPLVRFSTTAKGPDVSALPGDVVDVPDAFATDLIAGGFAVAVGPEPTPEPTPETAPPADPAAADAAPKTKKK